MPQVEYSVDLIDDVWTIALGEKRFGPYSTLETAVAAASKAARQAEERGYEAILRINTPPDAPDAPEADSEADAA